MEYYMVLLIRNCEHCDDPHHARQTYNGLYKTKEAAEVAISRSVSKQIIKKVCLED